MAKNSLIGLIIGSLVFIGMNGAGNASTINTYTDLISWSSNAGPYSLEDFQDTNLITGLSYNSSSGGYIDSNGYFYDRPTNSVDGTTWSFSSSMYSFGGDWNLSGPGNEGMGLLLTMTDGSNTFVAPEISRSTNNFWGFVSDTAFTSVAVRAGTQFGYAETYHLDDLVFSNNSPAPEPSTMMLFGIGLLGLARINRRFEKDSR